jgi:hypothetical protein
MRKGAASKGVLLGLGPDGHGPPGMVTDFGQFNNGPFGLSPERPAPTAKEPA